MGAESIEKAKYWNLEDERLCWKGVLDDFKSFNDTRDSKDKTESYLSLEKMIEKLRILSYYYQYGERNERWTHDEKFRRFVLIDTAYQHLQMLACKAYNVDYKNKSSRKFKSSLQNPALTKNENLDNIKTFEDVFKTADKYSLDDVYAEEDQDKHQQTRLTILGSLYFDGLITQLPEGYSETDIRAKIAEVEKEGGSVLLADQEALLDLSKSHSEQNPTKRQEETCLNVSDTTMQAHDKINAHIKTSGKERKELREGVSRNAEELIELRGRVTELEMNVEFREIQDVAKNAASVTEHILKRDLPEEETNAKITELEKSVSDLSRRVEPLLVSVEYEKKIKNSKHLSVYCSRLETKLTSWYMSILALEGGYVKGSEIYSARTLKVKSIKNTLFNLSKFAKDGPAKAINIPGISESTFGTVLKDGFLKLADTGVGQAINGVLPGASMVVSGLKYLLERGDKKKQRERIENSEKFLKNIIGKTSFFSCLAAQMTIIQEEEIENLSQKDDNQQTQVENKAWLDSQNLLDKIVGGEIEVANQPANSIMKRCLEAIELKPVSSLEDMREPSVLMSDSFAKKAQICAVRGDVTSLRQHGSEQDKQIDQNKRQIDQNKRQIDQNKRQIEKLSNPFSKTILAESTLQDLRKVLVDDVINLYRENFLQSSLSYFTKIRGRWRLSRLEKCAEELGKELSSNGNDEKEEILKRKTNLADVLCKILRTDSRQMSGMIIAMTVTLSPGLSSNTDNRNADIFWIRNKTHLTENEVVSAGPNP